MADNTFDHAVITLLGFATKSHPYRALRNDSIESIYQIASLIDSDINDLRADELDENDKVKMSNQHLKMFHQNAIRMMGNYFRYLLDQHGDSMLTEKGFLMNATYENWINFRVKPDIALSYSTPQKQDQPVVTPTQNTTSPSDLIFQSFLRGAKRDKKDYEALKDERQYDNWQRSFFAQARAHHVDRVLNANFTPIDDNDAMMFRLQQQFLYTVLDSTLKTDMGKTIVRKHQFTGNAQQVWSEFTNYMKKSTRAKYSSSKLLTYLTTSKYDKTWKGSAQGYILYWLARAQEYDAMVSDPDSRLNEHQKQNLLQNAVNDVSELRQVRINCDIIDSEHPDLPSISYQRYTNLLQSAAESLDAHNTDFKSTRTQQVFFTDNQNTNDFENDWENDNESYNVDTYLSNVMSRGTPTQSRTPRINVSTSSTYPFNVIPRESWLKIPADVREELSALRRKPVSSAATSVHSLNTTIPDLDVYHPSPTTINTAQQSENDNSIPSDTTLIDYALNKTQLTEPELQQIVNQTIQTPKRFSSNNRTSSTVSTLNSSDKEVVINGITYVRKINFTCIEYRINTKIGTMSGYSLVDRGANGGLFGDDVRILETSNRRITITGIDNHQIRDLPICTGAGYGLTNKGPVIFVMNQYAYLGQGKTIHSSAQLEAFKIIVEDKSRKLGGGQKLITPDGYLVPLDFIGGLAYFKLRPPTDQELVTIPHVILTSDHPWDPTCVDNSIDATSMDWYTEQDIQQNYGFHPFNAIGEYKEAIVNELVSVHGDTDFLSHRLHWQINEYISAPEKVNYEQLRPYFGWCSADLIERTFENTTQFIKSLHLYDNMRKHYKSRFPAFNVIRRNEPVATDTIMSDVPSVHCGSRCAQLFVGRESLVTDVYGMKTDKEFVSALEDNIRRRGAMEKLISDRAMSEIGSKVRDILRALFIDDWQSEPHHQHQNYAERHYATIKARTNVLLNRSGAPASMWLYCLRYVCFVFNHVSSKSLQWRTPLQVLTGETSDISILMLFTFWEEVFYSTTNASFPSDSTEQKGNFIGFSEHVGDLMTFIIYSQETKRILHRSNVRTALDATKCNHRLSTDGELDNLSQKSFEKLFIQSKHDHASNLDNPHRLVNMPGYTVKDLVGRTFLDLPTEDGQKYYVRITKIIAENIEQLDLHPEKTKFLVTSTAGGYEKILAYNEILNFIDDKDYENDNLCTFKEITAHQGPISPSDSNYKGSKYNVLVEWEDGEATFEPLDIMAADDPVTCALYAKRHNLLDTPGWKRFKRLVRENTPGSINTHLIIQSLHYKAVKFKYGYQVPTNHRDAIMLDSKAKDNLWRDSERAEIDALNQYRTFIDLGKGKFPSKEYKMIRCHMVYDVKHDGRHRSRFVAGGHLTPVPEDSTYSGVISLRALRLIVFLSQLNSLQLWGADVSSAYLEARTQEKVYFVAGEEFGEQSGHTLLVDKALYGLRTSGLRWHEKFADILRDLGFHQCRGEPDIWMRKNGIVYEYIGVYVDDLAIAALEPDKIVKLLETQHNLRLKGGCDFLHDKDGTLSFGPKTYINKMVDNFERSFGEKPREYSSPLEKNDHPELDESEFLDSEGIVQYQSLIGAAQWAVSLGRFDIQTAIMTMSHFRVKPRQGHLNRLKRIYGYLKRFKDGAIRVRINEPDLSLFQCVDQDWLYSVYGNVSEAIPNNLPEPLGKSIVLTHYVDANLYHDLVTGRAVTGILHFINGMPLEWYSKRQATVETATYGAEFVAARVATDQIIDLRLTLRYLGVEIKGKSHLFGDNGSVILSSTIPHSSLKKRHNALSYHRVREAIAAGVMYFHKIHTSKNYSDVLSKHSGYQQAWPLIKMLLFWCGEDHSNNDSTHRTNGECQVEYDAKCDGVKVKPD